jgi:hypothetical protein
LRQAVSSGFCAGSSRTSHSVKKKVRYREEVVRLPWTKQPSTAVKGAIQKASVTHTDPRARENLLTAIGKAMLWMQDLTEGTTLAEIAHREGKGKRQIRLLLPLAFLPPASAKSICDDKAPQATLMALSRNVPLLWNTPSEFLGHFPSS